MLEDMIKRCNSKDTIALGIELAEKTIEEGNKNFEYFKLRAKKYTEDEILFPYGKRLGDVIKSTKAYVKFHEELKSKLEEKYFITSH